MGTIQRSMWAMMLVGGALLGGCAASEDEANDATTGMTEEAIASTNGLNSINGLNSLNGLNSYNGFNSLNGLNSMNGLSSTVGMMTTAAGRATVSYLVRCALPANRSIVKKDQNNVSYTYTGQLGLAPEWETGACTLACQEYISACMMAHVNTTGQHVPLWLVADKASVGWGISAAYPKQEGSFFGNIFVTPPQAFYCDGKDFAVGVVAGRIGSAQVGAPYLNSFSWNYYTCNSPNTRTNCTKADAPNAANGFKACYGYNHIMTVWRQ